MTLCEKTHRTAEVSSLAFTHYLRALECDGITKPASVKDFKAFMQFSLSNRRIFGLCLFLKTPSGNSTTVYARKSR